jgi:hypothetical protein
MRARVSPSATSSSFALAGALSLALLLGPAMAQQMAVRPEVAKPMQQASELLKGGKAAQALAKVKEAEAVPNKNPAEQLLVLRMKGSAAQRAGDSGTAIQAFEAAIGTGRLSGPEQAQLSESIAFAYSQQKNWGKVSEWAQKAKAAGGGSAQLNQLLAYVQSQSGDYNAVLREAQGAVTAAEQAGRKPAEDDLLRLADAQNRTNNKGGYSSTLEKLVVHYPKKDYWSAHLANLQRKPGFSDRLGLDVMRLKLKQGLITKSDEYMEMAQLAMQAGLPTEAKSIMDKGYAAGALGTGAEADRQKRLRDLILKTESETNGALEKSAAEAAAQKDGNDLVKAGMVYASRGEAAKAIGLLEQGIAKGQLRRPDDAKLRLGLAQLMNAATRTKGLQTLKSIDAKDGTSDIARLWALAGV